MHAPEHALVRQSEARSRARNIQLDAALNNMSQALCMFDAERRLIVCNDNYARIFDLPPELTKAGTPVEAILDHRIALGLFPGEDAAGPQTRPPTPSWPTMFASKSLLEFRDGRIFSVVHQPMAEGGWVATHEDITEQVRAQRELQAPPCDLGGGEIESRARRGGRHGRRINSLSMRQT